MATPVDVALLCNPRAGGRWKVLADVLDSDEARGVHRIVTDDIDDVREALAGLGQRVKLLCVYGGDGTIYQVINELLRDPATPRPRLALLGGGTMNVTSAWCGMRGTPGENFREVMRAYHGDRLLWRDVPLLAVAQQGQVRHGFTFGMGPVVRILERYEAGRKGKLAAVGIGIRAATAAVSGVPRDFEEVLREMEAQVTLDGERLPHDRYAAVFANVTGAINPFVEPFTGERTRESFHCLAYAVSAREFAMMIPLLVRGVIPIDPKAWLNPISTWRKGVLALVGRSGLPGDPRYVNGTARELVIETVESCYTIDGEVLVPQGHRFDVRLGPVVSLATLDGG